MNEPTPLAKIALKVLVALNLTAVACLWAAARVNWTRRAISERSLFFPAAKPGLVNLRLNPLANYSQILARPAFLQSRRPWKPPPGKRQGPQTPSLPSRAELDVDISIGGIAIAGRSKKVLLMTKTKPVGVWLSEGEKMEGWTVRYIGSSAATLKSGDRTVRLALYPKGL